MAARTVLGEAAARLGSALLPFVCTVRRALVGVTAPVPRPPTGALTSRPTPWATPAEIILAATTSELAAALLEGRPNPAPVAPLPAAAAVAGLAAAAVDGAGAEVAPPVARWTRWLAASDWPAAPRALVTARPRPPGTDLPGPVAGDVEPCAGWCAAGLADVEEPPPPVSPFGRSATNHTARNSTAPRRIT